MDREKAADLLDNLIGMVEDNHGADYDTALKMGIEALSTSGDGPEPVDDTISRQAAIDALGDEPEVWTGKDEYAMGLNNQWHYDRNAIKAVPSAQPEQQWISCSIPPIEKGIGNGILLYGKDGNYAVGWYDDGDYCTWDDRFDMDEPVAWCKLPKPWRGEENVSDE